MNLGDVKRGLILVGVLILLLLPGCWSHRELNKLGVVSALGLDLNRQGEICVTVEIINPHATKRQNTESTTRILSSKGQTCLAAMRNLMTQSQDQLYYQHNQIIVIGEDLARAGLDPVLDFFERHNEFRMFAWVMVSKGKAEEVIRAPFQGSSISGVHLKFLAEEYKFASKSIAKTGWELMDIIFKEGSELALGKIEVAEEKGETIFYLRGGGAFKDTKLLDWLDEKEARGYLWVHNMIEGGIVTASPREGPAEDNQAAGSSGFGESVSFEIRRAKSKVKPVLEGDELSFVIEISVQSELGERTDRKENASEEDFRELEAALGRAVIKEVQTIVGKAQKELNSDILGFGLAAQRKYPGYWNQHKEHWEEIFPALDVEILVKAVVDNYGDIR